MRIKKNNGCCGGDEEEIRQLENKKKRLIQEQKGEERKNRINRLCKRIGLFEKLLPDTIPLTEEQFKTFLEQTLPNTAAAYRMD